MNANKLNPHHPLLAQLATIPACQRGNAEADWFPPVDILEDPKEYLFKIDLPEMKSEEIRVVVESDGLLISGERPNPWQESKTYLRIERPHGYFERRFALPDDASRVEIESDFQASVLAVHVRKVRPLASDLVKPGPVPKLKIRSLTSSPHYE
jgi:HSP20 family protein